MGLEYKTHEASLRKGLMVVAGWKYRGDAAWRLEVKGRCPDCASRLEEVIRISSARCDRVSPGEMQKTVYAPLISCLL